MIHYIPRSEINVSDAYKVRIFSRNEQLEQSIRKYGLYKPLILFSKTDKVLMDGYARYQCSSHLENIPVLLEEEIKSALLKSIHINMSENPYSEIEKATLIKIASDVIKFDKKECIDIILPALKMKKKMETVNEALSIFNMNQQLLFFLKQKKAPLQLAVTLSLLSQNNQNCLMEIAMKNNMSLSQLRKINDLLFYIQKREGKGYQEIIEASDLQDELEKFLFCRRYPQYSELLEKIQSITSDYKGQLSIRDDLEADEFIFSGRIKTVKDVETLIGLLDVIRNDTRVYNLLKELKDV